MVLSAVVVGAIVLGILYKKNGILVGISTIGYLAILLVLIRYTNVILTLEGICGILVSIVLYYIFVLNFLYIYFQILDLYLIQDKTKFFYPCYITITSSDSSLSSLPQDIICPFPLILYIFTHILINVSVKFFYFV